MLGTDFVLFLALQARLASLSVAVLTCCLLVGMVASLVEVFRGCSSVDCVVRGFLPVACAWFSGLSGLLGSCFWSFLPRSSSGCGCFSWPPVRFILRLPGLLGDCGFADVDGGFGSWGAEWMFAFGRSSSSVSTLLPASLMGGREVLPVFLGSRFWTRCFFHLLLVAPSLEAPQRGSSCRFG